MGRQTKGKCWEIFRPATYGSMPALGFALVLEEGLARLSLALRAVRCGVPQGVQFVGEWGDPRPFDPLLSTKAMKKG